MESCNPKLVNGSAPANGSKNRLRIQGTAILERDHQPNITASYDYNTGYVNEFFEEDVNQLECLQLNKIALGMTIFKKENTDNGNHANGKSNGTSLMLSKFDQHTSVPFLTDVIWSRTDIANPSANRNAYIIKQHYPRIQQKCSSLGDKCNNFLCGFLTCCAITTFYFLVTFVSQTSVPSFSFMS